MGVDLGTTNLFLGIMAVVSVLQALVLIGVGVGAFMMYRRTMQLVPTWRCGRLPRCGKKWTASWLT